jgi:hypothetical protein
MKLVPITLSAQIDFPLIMSVARNAEKEHTSRQPAYLSRHA